MKTNNLLEDIVRYFLKKVINKLSPILGFIWSKLKWRLLVILPLSSLAGILDGIGLAMFLPIISTIASGDETVKSVDDPVLDILKSHNLYPSLTNVLIVLCAAILLKSVILLVTRVLLVRYKQFFVKKIRIDFIQLLSGFKYEKFIKLEIGHLQNTVTNEVYQINNGLSAYLELLQKIVLLMTYIFMAVSSNASFALMVALGGIFSGFVFRPIYRKTRDYSGTAVTHAGLFHKSLTEMIYGFKYLVSSGRVDQFSSYIYERADRIETVNVRLGTLNALVASMREPLVLLVVFASAFIEMKLLQSSFASLMFALLVFYRAMNALMGIQTNYNTLLKHSGSFMSMIQFVNSLRNDQRTSGNYKISFIKDSITLRNVHFKYDDVPIIKDLSLTIKKNQSIGIVGLSGSGKSTLLNILSGLLKPDEGKYLVDGVPISEIDIDSLQRRIGYITQEPILFDDSLYNNVTLWDNQTKLNFEHYKRCIQKAKIDTIVDSLPEGHETNLGANGVRLSGGQKQRLSIARELYKEAELLFLDEATSSLDSITESDIMESIDHIIGNDTTVIIAAHRLSTLKKVDMIVLLKDGEITDSGSYSELLSRNASFNELVEAQRV